MCDSSHAIFDKRQLAWLDAQKNSVAIMEREADPALVYRAHDLLETDPAESFKQYLALAENGSIWSMAIVGQMFELGTGTARDLLQAEEWYLSAYRAGSDSGLTLLGELYQESGRYQEAREVFRAGVDRGFAPAMLGLASSYRNSPDWQQRREESLALLERGAAAGDLFARRYLAGGMTRGWFGLRHIPNGIRLLFSTADEMADLLNDETTAAQTDTKVRPGFLRRLCRGMVASQT
jgi:TPR repeat protein